MSSPHLSPNFEVSSHEHEARSPRSGYRGRKGYNAAPTGAITPPSSHRSTSPMPSHREGLFGRKGYNQSPSRSRNGSVAEARSHSPSPSASPSFHDGLGGRKGYNGEPPVVGYPQSPNPSCDSPPAAHHREGLHGRKGYNASPSRDCSPSPSHQGSSPAPSFHEGGLGGRKGYNGSPRLSPHVDAEHNGDRGRKGYNAEPHQADPEIMRRYSLSPARSEHATEHGLGITHRENGLGGRKGYNSSPRRTLSPAPEQQQI